MRKTLLCTTFVAFGISAGGCILPAGTPHTTTGAINYYQQVCGDPRNFVGNLVLETQCKSYRARYYEGAYDGQHDRGDKGDRGGHHDHGDHDHGDKGGRDGGGGKDNGGGRGRN